MDINFELYKAFYFAARSGSFSGAAQKLYISQSAVSQAIKSLEDKLGSRLFVRKARNVGLTPEGDVLYRHVEQAYNFIKAAEARIQDMQNLRSGEVRIGVGDTICRYFLVPCLEKFTQRFPDIKIRVVNRTSSQIISILKNGLLDLGVVTLPVDDAAVIVKEFIDVEDAFVASDKYARLKGRPLGFKEIAGLPLLLLPRSSSTRRNLEAFMDKRGISLTPEIELESVDLLVEFARIGMGIAHVLRESAKNAIGKGELFELDTVEELPARKLGIVSLKEVPLSRASSEFAAFLRKQAEI